MTDLELTKACAEAIGLRPDSKGARTFHIGHDLYDPLHDDAQAMQLVKRIGLDCLWTKDGWIVGSEIDDKGRKSLDLNRAICTYVAQMTRRA